MACPSAYISNSRRCAEVCLSFSAPTVQWVLNHDDLLEMNIHVDEATGHITGIVDWADAKIAPFGTSFWGLQTLLGVQTSSAWLWHPAHDNLRTEFWDTFYGIVGCLSDEDRQTIAIGRLFGLFRTYGFDRRPERRARSL
jgi:hypothetical protein